MKKDEVPPNEILILSSGRGSIIHYVFRCLIILELIFPTILLYYDMPWFAVLGAISAILFLAFFLLAPLMNKRILTKSRMISLVISGVFIFETLGHLLVMFFVLFLHGGSSMVGINIAKFSFACLLIPSMLCNILDVKEDFSGVRLQNLMSIEDEKIAHIKKVKIIGVITGFLSFISPLLFLFRKY
ncbi:hypothetical protein NEF87_001043 [Candidatus Lokiarchaeum ossiferum]|uniref:Uncharacterized protein n=1 Tax=Candidatus Lokiarchaeum ossiferum TaxID=2951803 RepID=A0ABY6HMM6_9ARCH|nr:hypothetical protein NEF87_001043 [Candidatus Lokiarchaeum sp. B-35]